MDPQRLNAIMTMGATGVALFVCSGLIITYAWMVVLHIDVNKEFIAIVHLALGGLIGVLVGKSQAAK